MPQNARRHVGMFKQWNDTFDEGNEKQFVPYI
jgi:hypothetical protein